MTKIEIMDYEAERIKKIVEMIKDKDSAELYGEAYALEAIFDCLDKEASFYNKTAEEFVAEYLYC